MNQVKTRLFTAKIGIVTLFSSLISLGLANSAQALTTGISNFTGGTRNPTLTDKVARGFEFRATEDLTVTALGVYDIDGDGLNLSTNRTGVDVALWNDSGVRLGSVSIPGGTSVSIQDGFRYVNLSTPINLTENISYRVAADMSDIDGTGNTSYIDSAVPTTLNGIDSIVEYRNNSSTFSFPNNIQTIGQANLGGNILFEDNTNITSVPFEFSPTLGLLLVGGLLGGSKVYRRNQSKKTIN